MYEDLKIILYPDPRLKKMSATVKAFDERLAALVGRMFELMREARGVGLAAPQVGLNIRLFIINPTGKPEDDRVYVNPVLSDPDDEETAEEGCLSLPAINVEVSRSKKIHMQAQDLAGNSFEQVESGYIPRIWQHEFDHLNGTLITDRMGLAAKLEYRKTLKDLEDKYAAENPPPPPPPPTVKKRKRS